MLAQLTLLELFFLVWVLQAVVIGLAVWGIEKLDRNRP